MPPSANHAHSLSQFTNNKAQLINAYNELGRDLAESSKIRVVGNYDLGKVIGEGSFGKVRIGTHRLTSTRVAIKQIPKSLSAQLTREIHHHRRLHHPHVTQLYEIIATEHSIWLVTELCSGGELFDYLVEKGRLSEAETKIIFGQLCLAVNYIHEKGVVHRDLKLENVLLDERCRVKLSDFGFTREFEKNVMLETFCGTTGYASPEMLLGQKYLGQEVDIWSLGIILYSLLTGTLPFDDDDEAAMRNKIIAGIFEDPEWLSHDARDLIRNILQQDPLKRPSIPQLLSHPWFATAGDEKPDAITSPIDDAKKGHDAEGSQTPTSPSTATLNTVHQLRTASSSSSATYHSFSSTQLASSEAEPSPGSPQTPSQDSVLGQTQLFDDQADPNVEIRRKKSQSTITSSSSKKKRTTNGSNIKPDDSTPRASKAVSLLEEDPITFPTKHPATTNDATSLPRAPSAASVPNKSPPISMYPTRTPVRTKRRSVASTISPPPSPSSEETTATQSLRQDFVALLTTPFPVVFSTPLERELLNNLSMLGFDTGQMVHSVLTDACDSAGALWWILRKKWVAKKQQEALQALRSSPTDFRLDDPPTKNRGVEKSVMASETVEPKGKEEKRRTTSDELRGFLPAALSAPNLTFVPPTPVAVAYDTLTSGPLSTRSGSPPRNSVAPQTPPSSQLSPTTSATHTPVPSLPTSPKFTKPRSGSVSMLQRATTVLGEATGLVRKKSEEAVKDRDSKERERAERAERAERERSGDEPRSPASTGKLQKSPPIKSVKDGLPPIDRPGSPWVLAQSGTPTTALPGSLVGPSSPIPAASPSDTLTALPTLKPAGSQPKTQGRHRASLLSAFRTWFIEDRRKRKVPAAILTPSPSAPSLGLGNPPMSAGSTRGYPRSATRPNEVGGSAKKGKAALARRGKGHKDKRASISSRRSSSVNSRRSSITSNLNPPAEYHALHPETPVGVTRQRSDASRRSIGAQTPISEGGDYSSRPSSVRSFNLNTPIVAPPGSGNKRHSKSSSTSSNGSAGGYAYAPSASGSVLPARPRSRSGAASPLQKYHQRGGSGSSQTRVVRQLKTVHGTKIRHGRSGSASSIHSAASSKLEEGSESEMIHGESYVSRTGSPFIMSRKSSDERRAPYSTTVLVAQKKQTPFMNPSSSLGRSSWKKAWGAEPPSWQFRSTVSPIDTPPMLVIDSRTSVRDVFSGKPSIVHDDDSDWVDEDDDLPAFAGGLGQLPASSHSSAYNSKMMKLDSPTLGPASRSGNPYSAPTKRSGRGASGLSNTTGMGNGYGSLGAPVNTSGSNKAHSPITISPPLPGSSPASTETSPISEARGRRQLPNTRPGPSFGGHAIQEEDEDEE